MARGLLSDPRAALQKKIKSQGGQATPRQQNRLDFLATQKKGNKKGGGGGGYGGLNRNQKNLVRGQEQADLALQGTASGLQGRIADSYSQPFDTSGITAAPGEGDYNTWYQGQMDELANNFDTRNNHYFDQQRASFDQQMHDRGIPMGSELYTSEKNRLEQSIADQRQNALVQAHGLASENARGAFDMGTTAHQNQYQEALNQRNMALSEYGALRGAMSGYADAANNQMYGLQNMKKQFGYNSQLARMGGGGGGGGGGEAWQQYGFSSPQEYDQYQLAQQREQDMWNWQNNPQFQKQSQPNPYAQLGGGIFGSLASGIGQGLGKSGNLFGYQLWNP